MTTDKSAGNIIPFNVRDRVLGKVRAYLTAMDRLVADGDLALEVLLKGFEVAEEELKVKIVIMMGTLASERVLDPLLAIMRDGDLNGSVRQAAAVQLSLVGGSLHDPDTLVAQLLVDLEHSDPSIRANAAFALGWEGNLAAAPELVDCLADDDIEVQQAAVNALSNLRDDSFFSLLTQRLQHGSKEQQRSILYNLGHFPSRQGEVARICKTYLQHQDADLRYDALVVFNGVADSLRNLDQYERCIDDADARIRELALTRLVHLPRQHLLPLAAKIRSRVQDPSVRVRQAATRLIHHIDSINLAMEGD